MHPRIAGCSFIYPKKSLEEGIRQAAEFGFRTVDVGVGGANGHLSPRDAAREPEARAADVRRAAERHAVRLNECFSLNFGRPINDPDPEARAETQRLFAGLLVFAKEAGFRSVLLLPGPVHAPLGPRRSFDLAVEGLTPLADAAAVRGMALHVETDCDSCAATPEAAEELCVRVPGISLTLDYSHFIFHGHAQEEVERLHRYAAHLHVRQASRGRIVEAVEKGTIDYGRVLRGLEQAGYRGLFCVEYLHLPELDAWGIDAAAETRRMAAELDREIKALKGARGK